MNANVEIIGDALAQIVRGEPAPSFSTPQFASVIAAVRGIAEGPHDGRIQRADYGEIGMIACRLLLLRLVSSMQAERALAIMRDNQKPLC